MMNKIGICAWSMPIDGPYACRLASELGIDGIQLDVGSYERSFPLGRKSVQQAYLEAAETYGVEYPSIAVRVSDEYSMTSGSGSAEYEIVKAGIVAAIQACRAMDVRRILVPNFEKSAIRSDQDFETVVDVLRWACDLAADAGIVIAAENTLSVSKTQALFRDVGRKNLALYFDFQNYYLHNGSYTPDILEALYDDIAELHVKDGKNKDLSGALLGEGDTAFFDSAQVLVNKRYEGWIVLENYYDMKPLCGPSDDPVALIRNDLETVRKVFG